MIPWKYTAFILSLLGTTMYLTSAEETLLLADSSSIIQSDITVKTLKYLVNDIQHIADLDFDLITNSLYWTNQLSRKIQRTVINVTTGADKVVIEDFLDLGTGYPDSLAIDWYNRKLYWSDSAKNTIERISLDKSGREVMFSGLNTPHRIRVDPTGGTLYWINKGVYVRNNGSWSWKNPTIEKANLNKTQRSTIVSTRLKEPTALARDHYNNDIYWADTKKKTIEKCNSAGWNQMTVVHASSTNNNQSVVSDPGGLTVSKYFLFWTDSTQKLVYYKSKIGRRTPIPIQTNLVKPTAVHVYRQPVNKCLLSGGCDADVHECIDKSTGPYLCSCPAGTQFNNSVCEDIDECTLGIDSCMHTCINTEGSYRCGCNLGYKLTNNTMCTDVNECLDTNNTCQLSCINTPGSYLCSCNSTGLKLADDGKSCDKITCESPPTSPGVNMTCDPSPYYVGHVCHFFCNNRGNLHGNPNITCTLSGQWTQLLSQPYCYIIPVEPPLEIDWTLIGIKIHPNTVEERAAVGTHVGILSLDIPPMFSHMAVGRTTYDVSTKNTPFVLQMISSTTYLTIKSKLNYEATKSYSLNISAVTTDYMGKVQVVSSVIKINVIDVNEPPSKPTLSRTSRPESLADGKVVAQFKSEDPDFDPNFPEHKQHLQYFLVQALDSKEQKTNIFEAADDYGILLRGRFDYETSPFYTLTIKVQDTANVSLSATNTVRFNITDVNEAPTDILLSNTEIKEIPDEIPNQFFMPMRVLPTVGILTTVDEDNPDFHTYEIVKDQFIDFHVICFEIKNETGASGKINVVLKANDPICFNYEQAEYREVTIKTTDKGGLSYQKVFSIRVTDVNESPAAITFTGNDIMENSPNGTTVGMVFVKDPDKNDHHNVTLVFSTNNWLALRDNYKIVVAGDIDYETSTYIKLRVKAQDKGGLTIYANFTVMVENKAEGPVLTITTEPIYKCTDGQYQICLNETIASKKVVAKVASATPNTTLFIRDHTGSFTVSEKGEIMTANSLDYESGVRAIALRLTASEPRGGITEKYIYVKVLNVNEVPKEVFVSNTILGPDATTGTNVGELKCVDDSPLKNLSFTIVSNPDGLFKLQGKYLVIAKPLPTDKLEYKLSIKCSDGVNFSPVKQFMVEHSTNAGKDIKISLSNNKVLENALNGTLIGRITVTSNVTVDMLTISLENAAWYPFEVKVVNNFKADLILAKAVDYEAEPYLDVVIKAYSHITHATGFQNFEIQILNVPEKVVLSTNTFEECEANSNIGMVSVGDPAQNSTYTFTIDTVLPITLTNLTNTSATLMSTKPLDFEDRSMGYGARFKLTVTVKDTKIQNSVITKMFNVKLANVNEAPTKISLTKSVVLENTPPGTVVSQVLVEDPDSAARKETFVCDFIRNDHGWIRLNKNLSLTVAKLASINYEDPSFKPNVTEHDENLMIECWDQGGLAITSKILPIHIKDVNEAPEDINTNPRQLNIPENSPQKTQIGDVIVDDPDRNDTFSLQLLPRGNDQWNPSNLFYIENGKILSSRSLNYEERTEYKIKIIATDKGGLKLTRKFRINVLDKNDPPTKIYVQRNLAILEGQAKGAFLSFLYTKDEDYDQGHIYQIISQSPPDAVTLRDNNKLVVSNPLMINYETSKTVNITFKSTDRGSPPLSITQTVIIPVENVNEAPTGLVLTPGTVKEGALNGTVVGNITFSDPGSKSSDHYFVYLKDDAEGRFKVATYSWALGVYQILVADGGPRINYEEKPVYNITLFTLDYGTVYEQTLEVKVIDVDEPPVGLMFQMAKAGSSPPADIDVLTDISTWNKDRNNTVMRIPESIGLSAQVKTTIAYVYILDEDMVNTAATEVINKYQFTLTDVPFTRGKRAATNKFKSPGVDSFGVEAVTGSKWLALYVKMTLDYEAKSDYKFYITCKTTAKPQRVIMQPLEFVVVNVDEPPYAVVLGKTRVKETKRPDSKIGSLTILDQDKHQSGYSVSILGANYPVYLSGMDLYLGTKLNYEKQSQYHFPILVSEINNRMVRNSTFEIGFNVTDVNEPPCCLRVNNKRNIVLSTNISSGYIIGDLKVKDEDAVDTGYNFQFKLDLVKSSLKGDNNNKHFRINNGKQLVYSSKIAPSLNQDAKFSLSISTSDSTGLPYKGTINVRIAVNSCGDKVCHKDAVCSQNGGTTVCQCKEGFTGSGLECTSLNPCEPNPCNSGQCFQHKDGNYLCKCSEYFSGLNCEFDKQYCAGIKCPYGGSCIPGTTGYTCECDEPFTKDCSGCVNPNDAACQPIPQKSSKKTTVDKYLPAIIAVTLVVFVIIVIVIIVAYMMRRQRFKTVNKRIRFVSETDSVSVQSEPDINANGDRNYTNPLYDSVAFKNNNVTVLGADSQTPDYTKKVPIDMCDPSGVQPHIDNTYPSELTRTMSQQEELSYNHVGESQS